jgi:hypothetical protein
MAAAVRKLVPGEVIIAFVRPDGTLIGDFADPSLGHDTLSYSVPSLRGKLATGHAIAITLAKTQDGKIKVFGSGAFPPPEGGLLSPALRELCSKLVE